jgi:hypothetical protein
MGARIDRKPVSATIVVGFAVWLGTTAILQAQTGYPMLMSLRPVAVQVGTTAEVTVAARYNMLGAYQVLISGDGVSGEVVPPEVKQADAAKKPTAEKLKVRITAAANAMPGVRDLRIATPQGVSTVGQLVVVRDPVVIESGDNNTTPKAQEITLPAAVCGAIEKNEDVDYFKFRAEAGEAVVFHVRCARLEDRIHDLQTHADPILTLRNSMGGTLAVSDNHEYYADPTLAYRFEQAGDYLLEIRDVRYQGNQYWEYCIEINRRPLVECIFPLAVAAGSTEVVQPLGPLVPADARTPWNVSTGIQAGTQWLELPLGEEQSNPVPVVIAEAPLAREAEGDNDLPAAAEPVAARGGINGCIDREGDVDCFSFEAKKGEAFSIEVIARRAQSALDSHLRIID